MSRSPTGAAPSRCRAHERGLARQPAPGSGRAGPPPAAARRGGRRRRAGRARGSPPGRRAAPAPPAHARTGAWRSRPAAARRRCRRRSGAGVGSRPVVGSSSSSTLRLADQRLGKAEALAHALGIGRDPALRGLGEADAFEQRHGRPGRLAAQGQIEPDDLAPGHGTGEADALGQEADPPPHLAARTACRIGPERAHRAGTRPDQARGSASSSCSCRRRCGRPAPGPRPGSTAQRDVVEGGHACHSAWPCRRARPARITRPPAASSAVRCRRSRPAAAPGTGSATSARAGPPGC